MKGLCKNQVSQDGKIAWIATWEERWILGHSRGRGGPEGLDGTVGVALQARQQGACMAPSLKRGYRPVRPPLPSPFPRRPFLQKMFNFPLSRVGSGGNETQNCLLGSGEYVKTLDIDKRTLGGRGRRGSAPAQSSRMPREAVSSCAHHAATSLGPMATPQSPAGDSLTARQLSRTL